MASTVWRGFITFGLISIPVRLFRAARAERVSLRRLYRAEAPERVTPSRRQPEPEENDTTAEVLTESPKNRRPPVPEPVLAPVQQVSLRKGSDEILPEKSIVKGYEYEKDRYVVIEPEELKNIAPKTATEMQIEEFVNLAEVDPVYFETSYYVVPEEAGQKAYALLYKSLQLTGLVAVAQFAMHSREHVVIIRPAGKGLIAHTMFFSSEVRADEEYVADTANSHTERTQLGADSYPLARCILRTTEIPRHVSREVGSDHREQSRRPAARSSGNAFPLGVGGRYHRGSAEKPGCSEEARRF